MFELNLFKPFAADSSITMDDSQDGGVIEMNCIDGVIILIYAAFDRRNLRYLFGADDIQAGSIVNIAFFHAGVVIELRPVIDCISNPLSDLD